MVNSKTKIDFIVRGATKEDIPAIFNLVEEYGGKKNIDKIKTKQSIMALMEYDGVFICLYGDYLIGGIAGIILPCMFSNDYFYITNYLYIREGFRYLTRKAIKELEMLLLPTKVTKIIFAVVENDYARQMQRFFKILGYDPFETHMAKTVSIV